MSIIGALDGIHQGKLSGWLADLEHLDRAMHFDLVVNNTYYGTFPAVLHRDDLEKNRIGSGNYGFQVDLPAALRKVKSLEIRIRPVLNCIESDFNKTFQLSGLNDYRLKSELAPA